MPARVHGNPDKIENGKDQKTKKKAVLGFCLSVMASASAFIIFHDRHEHRSAAFLVALICSAFSVKDLRLCFLVLL